MARIGYFAHTVGISGPNNNLLRLFQALDRNRFAPLVYFPAPGSAVATFSEMGERCRVVRMASLERTVKRVPQYVADLFRATWQVRRALIEDGVDLVHINTCVTPYPGIAARSLGIPVVWHVRECLQPNPINNLYLKGIVKLAHRVVVVSGAVQAHIERLVCGAAGKVVVINNGIDLNRFEQAMSAGKTRRELGLPEGKTLIVVPAFLRPDKGHETLLEATSVLVHEMNLREICVLFAGEEPPEEQGRFTTRLLHLRRSHRLEGHVQFLGLRKDLPAVLAKTDIVCLPSTCEDSFPNGVLEGMAAGKPVVASRVGGIPELIEDGRTGLLVTKGEVRELAQGLAQLIADEALARSMGKEGRRRVGQRFTGRLHAERIQKLYEELFRECGVRPSHALT